MSCVRRLFRTLLVQSKMIGSHVFQSLLIFTTKIQRLVANPAAQRLRPPSFRVSPNWSWGTCHLDAFRRSERTRRFGPQRDARMPGAKRASPAPSDGGVRDFQFGFCEDGLVSARPGGFPTMMGNVSFLTNEVVSFNLVEEIHAQHQSHRALPYNPQEEATASARSFPQTSGSRFFRSGR